MSDSAGLLVERLAIEYKLSSAARAAIFQLIVLMYEDGNLSINAIEDYVVSVLESILGGK